MWLSLSKYDHNDICPMCHENYGTTQAIFKTPCNHLFHNDCLNDYCEAHNGNVVCPVCRSDLGYSCTNVWAFKEGALTDREDAPLPFQNDEHILNIYRNQVPPQGGKRRRPRKMKTRKMKKRSRRSKSRRTRRSRKTK
jgi:hypothetical protein